MTRIVAIKRISLEGLSEGWDESCYAYVKPVTYQDNQEVNGTDFSKLDDGKQIDFQLAFVKDHFISGRIKLFNGKDFDEVDMEPDDTAASVGISDHLFAGIMGFDLDPKDIRKAAKESALPKTAESNIETSSSEESPAE